MYQFLANIMSIQISVSEIPPNYLDLNCSRTQFNHNFYTNVSYLFGFYFHYLNRTSSMVGWSIVEPSMKVQRFSQNDQQLPPNLEVQPVISQTHPSHHKVCRFPCSATSTNQIYTTKRVLHQQIYVEASVEITLILDRL